jgi:predicted HD phosphohydrolase
MSHTEARQFETNAHYEAAVRVRRYDDMGKVENMTTPALDDFRDLVERFVRRDLV